MYSEEGVCKRSGPDAGLYLTMELYLLAILCVYTVFSIGIILPVNYLSGDIGKHQHLNFIVFIFINV